MSPSFPRSASPAIALPASDPAALVAQVDERTLCARALGGDADAWNALVHKHNQRVVVSLLARGVRIDRAKDIAQETWIRLIEQQRAGRLSDLVLPGLAITQAAFFSLENARREGARKVPLSLDAEPEARDVVDPQADAETRLVTGERIERAEQVLAGCSASARAVFQLAYGGDGLSHAEVAAKVGLSLQRVRQILCEVRKQLRTALEGDGQ
jgi:RNA polymerase sigma-70 factor (ECF subfamily)